MARFIPTQSAGHIALIRSGEQTTRKTLEQHSSFAECWSGLLGLYYQGVSGEHESPYQEETVEHTAWHLRLKLLAASLDTSKLAFDATLSGYYVQGLMLSRHLLETWLQVRYASLRPDQAHRWFNTIDSGPPMEPSSESIIKEVLKVREDKEATIWIHEKAVKELRRAAHPSFWLIDQLHGESGEPITVGGRYSRKWCVQAFDRGTLATFALLAELKRQIPQPQEWQTALDRLMELRNSNYPDRTVRDDQRNIPTRGGG